MVYDKDVVSTLSLCVLSLCYCCWNLSGIMFFRSEESMLKKISNQPMNMNSREEYRIQRECPFPSPTFTPPRKVCIFLVLCISAFLHLKLLMRLTNTHQILLRIILWACLCCHLLGPREVPCQHKYLALFFLNH